MQNIFVEFLPPWIETGLQPAFYDKESGTVLQQVARMYAKVNYLIKMFNDFSKDTTDFVNDFVDSTNTEINRFETEVDTRVTNFEESTTETVNDYIARFVALKDFVDDYFDNLDVQEEINNKLDEMAENGTLQEIIADYLNSKAVFGYDTVASMKSATNLIDGSFARTMGFYSKNDGGGALYKIRESTTDDTIDEKFLIAIGSDGLVAELITSNIVNICQVGGQQNFGSVCNAVLSLNKSLYIPKQSFTSETTILVTNDNTEIICDGNIEFTGSNSTFISVASQYNIIKFNGDVTCGDTNVFMSLGSSTVNVTNNDIYINKVTSSKIGLWLKPESGHGVQLSRFTFNRIYSSEKGIYFNPGDVGANWINGCTFNGGALHGPYGVVTRKGENQTDPFNDIQFYRVSFTGHIQLPLDLQFMRNCWFDKLRMSENLEGTYDVILDNCRCVYISNEARLRLPRIQCINCTDPQSHNVFEAPAISDSGAYYIGDRLEFVENEPYVPTAHLWQMRKNNLYSYSDDDATFNVPEYYFDNMVVTIGAPSGGADLTYFLPKVFNEQVKRFYLQVKYKHPTTALRLRTQNNQTVIYFDGTSNTSISNKVYICERTSETDHSPNLYRWQIHEITPIISV